MNNLSTQEQILVNSEVSKNQKSPVVAYLLWLFLGIFGGHRFYFHKIGSAVAMLILSLTFIGVFVTAIWAIVDVFQINSWIKEDNQQLEDKAVQKIINQKVLNQESQKQESQDSVNLDETL